MVYDTRFRFIYDGIQLNFILSGNVQAVIIKRQEGAVIVFIRVFCPNNDLIQLVIGVKVIIIACGKVLKEAFRGF